VGSRINLIESPRGRRILFAILYFGEGAPIGFVWWALPTLLRQRGVGLEEIGSLTALLVLPWALKFLWAPLIDMSRTPRFTLRGWIATSQLAMILSLLALAASGTTLPLATLRGILLFHAFAAATQDVAVDALAIRSTSVNERGSINAWMQAGMLTGRAMFGGGALIIADAAGERFALCLLAASVTASMLVALAYRDVTAAARSEDSAVRFRARLGRALTRRSTWLALAFAATGAAGFEAAGVLLGPMLSDHGISTATIGTFLSAPAAGAMVAGGLLGGRLCRAFGTTAPLVMFGVVVTALVACLSPIVDSASGAAVWTTLSVLYFAVGAFTVSSYAFFMDRTDPELGSTQFSAYMGATNLCEAWAGHLSGGIAATRGYGYALACMAAVSLAALPMLSFDRIRTTEERS
jgi:PAT family beta-lactamase induction signal transducer AmpG